MKKLKKVHFAIVFTIVALLILPFCTRHNQVVNGTAGPLDTDTLYAVKGTATLQAIGGSAWDGSIEAAWNSAPKLTEIGRASCRERV